MQKHNQKCTTFLCPAACSDVGSEDFHLSTHSPINRKLDTRHQTMKNPRWLIVGSYCLLVLARFDLPGIAVKLSCTPECSTALVPHLLQARPPTPGTQDPGFANSKNNADVYKINNWHNSVAKAEEPSKTRKPMQRHTKRWICTPLRQNSKLILTKMRNKCEAHQPLAPRILELQKRQNAGEV